MPVTAARALALRVGLAALSLGAASASQCSAGCSAEFVDRCVPFRHQGYQFCRGEIDGTNSHGVGGRNPLGDAGCVAGCTDTPDMAALIPAAGEDANPEANPAALSPTPPRPTPPPTAAVSALSANELGAPQELRDISDVCAGRSSVCSVLLDVPAACAGASSDCPIGFFLHGHGGHNDKFVRSGADTGVHAHGWIGIYPQGEMYGGENPDGTPLRSNLVGQEKSGWNDGSMGGNVCAWDAFSCSADPNDGNFAARIIAALRDLGASGRVYMWGGSNGANSVQIWAANAGDDMPIAGISAGWGQLLADPPRSGPSPFNWNQPTPLPNQNLPGRVGDGRPVAQQAHHGDADPTIQYAGGPRFGSPVWVLMPEPESDRTWAEHNGCTCVPGSLLPCCVWMPDYLPVHAQGRPVEPMEHHSGVPGPSAPSRAWPCASRDDRDLLEVFRL